MSFKALWWIGLSVIMLGASLILGNECQIDDDGNVTVTDAGEGEDELAS